MTALNLTTNPLHFSTVPAEGKPPHAELLGTGLLVAWVADRVGLPKKLASTPHAKKLAAREITGRELLVAACKSKLTTEDVPAEVGKFLYGYTHRLFLSSVTTKATRAQPRRRRSRSSSASSGPMRSPSATTTSRPSRRW